MGSRVISGPKQRVPVAPQNGPRSTEKLCGKTFVGCQHCFIDSSNTFLCYCIQVQNFVDEAVQVYQDMQHSMTQRWEDFTQREEVEAAEGKVSEFKDAVVETVRGLRDNEKFRHVVDKTKESVAELSGRLADTWEKVRGIH